MKNVDVIDVAQIINVAMKIHEKDKELPFKKVINHSVTICKEIQRSFKKQTKNI